MALIFYKQSTAQERLSRLCYPYRPLLEDYFSPNNPDVIFTTYLYCYKSLTESRKKNCFDWRDVIEDLHCDVEFETTNEKYFKSVANGLMTLLYEFDCDDMFVVYCIVIIYILAKLGRKYQGLLWAEKCCEECECFFEKREAIFRNQILHNAYIFNSIHLADGKFLQVLLRYGFQCLASSEEYEIAKATAEKFA